MRVSENLDRVEISAGELGLVVKHFFEMRDVPVAIDRVTMEPASDVVVHAAGSHFAQSEQRHLERVFA